MTRLLLFRHAKAAPAEPGMRDFDRPLTARGRRDAAAAGQFLVENALHADAILCSSARRTRETLQYAAFPGFEEVTTYSDALYSADAAGYLAIVRAAGQAGTLLVIGHNPGLQQFALRLAGAGSDETVFKKIEAKFPTAALARFTLDGDWANLDFGGARLTHCLRPKDLG